MAVRAGCETGLQFPWNDESIQMLRELCAGGHSFGVIASRISEKFGRSISRSAVIGKANRLGVNKRLGPTAHAMRKKRDAQKLHAQKKPQPPRAQAVPKFQVDAEVLALAARMIDVAGVTDIACLEPHHCRWPVGDPRQPGFGWCGCDRVPGVSYCASHMLRAYTQLPKAGIQHMRQEPVRTPEAADA